jgi:hypothetical protein
MKTKFLVGMLLAASTMFAGPRVSIGIGVGGYGYVPPPVVVYAPPYPVYAPYPVYTAPYPVYAAPYPGYGYSWVEGYWYRVGPRRLWHAGYWAPRGYGHSYYRGHKYREVNRYYGYR